MANKRKRTRKRGNDDDFDMLPDTRTAKKRVNYAESDDSAFFDDDLDVDEIAEEEPEEPEAEESQSEVEVAAQEEDEDNDDDEDDDYNERRSTRQNGKSLKVKLRLRSKGRAVTNGDARFEERQSVAEAEYHEPEEKEESEDELFKDEDNDAQKSRSSRRSSTQQKSTSASAGRKLSSASIRQQLLQQKTQSYRPTSSNKHSRHTSEDEDEEFYLESSSADEDDDGEGSSSESESGFVVQNDSDFSDSNTRRRSLRTRPRVNTRSRDHQQEEENEDRDLTLAEELAELNDSQEPTRRKNLRARRQVNYQIFAPPVVDNYDYDDSMPPVSRRTTASSKRLHSTFGPFGGAGVPSIFGLQPRDGINGLEAAGGAADSDSSDDEAGVKNSANRAQTLGDLEQVTNPAGGLGLVRKNNLSDTDPLGVDMNIDFTAVGGLDDHINQLKEMVALPLMYPEVFQRFKVTPPRGVLFHGPPGTGKTLLARALAASCSTEGRKISFYMRKGADALSKWVGEAERQLRLLFEEARNTQPSIIFFDEIDGLAPVRSSKQEQIHASIVSTLLALMDGMDNRGQVIVIGATNRPDSIDPALRRPGRFDREFYFPLPNFEGRKKIVEIHTKGWEPPLKPEFVAEVAQLTKGYGGADLRALCTESALNAIQRRYPQIYNSNEKLLIDPSTINVSPRDFIVSVKKIIPSSQRSTASNASPLPKRVEPLLWSVMEEIKQMLNHLIPRRKKLTIAEEAMYEEDVTDNGFARENMMQEFESARVFRPRLLISGASGMGQEYVGAAVMQYLEGYHVQTFDLATLLGSSTTTVEAAIVQLFVEVKRHTPSVIYIPNIDSWYRTLSPSAFTTFTGLVRGISPVEQILLLGIVEREFDDLEREVKTLFGFSSANRINIPRPTYDARYGFFADIVRHISNAPTEYPDRDNRRKRKLEILQKAPPDPPKILSKAELEAQEEKDKRLKNQLKIKLSGLMDLLKVRYKRFRKPPIDDDWIGYLLDGSELDPETEHEYVVAENEMILQRSTGKKYHNMDLDVIEERLWNGYYCMPMQFLKDISYILEDSTVGGDRDKILKASEMYANVQVFVDEISDAQFLLDCSRVYEREQQRAQIYKDKMARKMAKVLESQGEVGVVAPEVVINTVPPVGPTPIERMFDDDEHEPVTNGAHEKEDTMDVDGSSPVPEAQSRIVPETVAPGPELEPVPVLAGPELMVKNAPEPVSELEVRERTPSPEIEYPPLELDKAKLSSFHATLAHSTDGFVVEQLEQVNSALMDVAYRCRSSWDRNDVLRQVITRHEQVVHDIRTALSE
ncbi:hypothetical protein V1512DRAFT_201734 [Lipomyces arxii]|uniref:uncharacterized protein n=1 Tax=Lipomyces arxii TaxID=56418 RepID=UPI0034CF42C9